MQELIYGPFLPLEQAREQGLTRYFTGKPCSKGHISERQTSDRSCIQCKLGRARAVRSLVKELVGRDENCPSNLSLLPGSRAEAIKSGCNYYFTGKSCSKGHFAYRYTGSGSCSECEHERVVSEDSRRYHRNHYKRNDEAKKFQARTYYYSNLSKGRADRRRYYRANTSIFKMVAKIRRRGLSSQYKLLSQQDKNRVSDIYKKRDLLNLEAGSIMFHVDHIIPVSKGGKHHPDNLQILTAFDNLSKGAKYQSDAA